jgi:hypothetical protein
MWSSLSCILPSLAVEEKRFDGGIGGGGGGGATLVMAGGGLEAGNGGKVT